MLPASLLRRIGLIADWITKIEFKLRMWTEMGVRSTLRTHSLA